MIEKAWDIIRIAGSFLTGGLAYVYGRLDGILITLVCVIILDYVTGVINGAIHHKLSSNVGYVGLLRKVLILLVVGLGGLVDHITNTGETFRDMLIAFYIANEGLSILENVDAMGVKIPKKLKEVLEQLKEKGGAE